MNQGEVQRTTLRSCKPIQDRPNSTASNDRNAFLLRDGAGQGAFAETILDRLGKLASRGCGVIGGIFLQLRVAFARKIGIAIFCMYANGIFIEWE